MTRPVKSSSGTLHNFAHMPSADRLIQPNGPDWVGRDIYVVNTRELEQMGVPCFRCHIHGDKKYKQKL